MRTCEPTTAGAALLSFLNEDFVEMREVCLRAAKRGQSKQEYIAKKNVISDALNQRVAISSLVRFPQGVDRENHLQ